MSTKQKPSHCFPYSVNKGPTVKQKKNHNKDWTETSELVSSKEEILLKTYKLSVLQCKTKISKSSSSDENVSRSCAYEDRTEVEYFVKITTDHASGECCYTVSPTHKIQRRQINCNKIRDV